MAKKCKKCGLRSEMDDAFKNYCPPCYEQRLNQLGIPFTALNLFLLYTTIFIVSPLPVSFWLLINLVATYLLLIPMIFLHEMAHATAGALTGMKTFSVTVGAGKVIFSRRILGFELEWRFLPISGRTVSALPPSSHARTKLFLQALSGPMVHVLFIALPVILYLTSFHESGNYLDSPAPLTALLFCNLLLLAENIWPRHSASSDHVPSDGWLLFHIPFYDEKTLSLAFGNYYLLLAVELMNNGQPQQALQLVEKSIGLSAGSPLAMAYKGWTYFRLEDFEQARLNLSHALEEDCPKGAMKFIVTNYMALTDIAAADNSLLPEADRYSLEAYKNIPWKPLVAGARGATLVELSEMDAGVQLLQTAYLNCQKDSFDVAIIACLLAIAEKKRGNGKESDKYLRIAEEADSACPLLTKARNEKLAVAERESCSPVRNDEAVMEFSALEKQILGWYKEKFLSPGLIAQIDNAKVAERQFTDEGMFLSLQVGDDIPAVEPNAIKQNPVNGPRIVGPEIDPLNKCDLLMRSGRLEFLRIFSSDTLHPEDLEDFELVDP